MVGHVPTPIANVTVVYECHSVTFPLSRYDRLSLHYGMFSYQATTQKLAEGSKASNLYNARPHKPLSFNFNRA